MLLTREQREALKRIYDRGPIMHGPYEISYREFRRKVTPEICGPAVLVKWAGMWLGIEKDGYIHS